MQLTPHFDGLMAINRGGSPVHSNKQSIHMVCDVYLGLGLQVHMKCRYISGACSAILIIRTDIERIITKTAWFMTIRNTCFTPRARHVF